MVRNLPAIPKTWIRSLGWRRSPGGGNGYPLQYSCLENSMDRRAWRVKSPWGHKEPDTTEPLTDTSLGGEYYAREEVKLLSRV